MTNSAGIYSMQRFKDRSRQSREILLHVWLFSEGKLDTFPRCLFCAINSAKEDYKLLPLFLVTSCGRF